jgi:hypothetical protein
VRSALRSPGWRSDPNPGPRSAAAIRLVLVSASRAKQQ